MSLMSYIIPEFEENFSFLVTPSNIGKLSELIGRQKPGPWFQNWGYTSYLEVIADKYLLRTRAPDFLPGVIGLMFLVVVFVSLVLGFEWFGFLGLIFSGLGICSFLITLPTIKLAGFYTHRHFVLKLLKELR